MEFEFKHFGLYQNKIEQINDIRDTLQLPPLWMDYQTVHQLHTYKEHYFDFVKPNENSHTPLLLQLPVSTDLLELEEIKSPHFTHINLAIQDLNILVLLSNKPFAIDQIVKSSDHYEISIIRVDRSVHLWGLNVVYPDGTKKVVGPEHIELSLREAEYTAKVNQKCVAAQFIQSQTQPQYKRKSFNGNTASKNRSHEFFKVVPIKSTLNKIVMKFNSNSRASAYQRLGVKSSYLHKGTVVPGIVLNKENAGGLFGNSSTSGLLEPQLKVSTQGVRKQLHSDRFEVPWFNKSDNLNKLQQQFKLKRIPELPTTNSKQLFRRSKGEQPTTKQLQNFTLIQPENESKLEGRVKSLLTKYTLDSFTFIPEDSQFRQCPKWSADSDHPYTHIPLEIVLKESDSPPPLSCEGAKSYKCDYPPCQGPLESIEVLAKYLQTRNKSILETSVINYIWMYRISKELGLKEETRKSILMFGISISLNSPDFGKIIDFLCQEQVGQDIQELVYDYFKQGLQENKRERRFEKILENDKDSPYQKKVIRNLAQILISTSKDYQSATHILQLLLMEDRIGIVDKINQESNTFSYYSRNLTHFNQTKYLKLFDSHKSYLLSGQKPSNILSLPNSIQFSSDAPPPALFGSMKYQYQAKNMCCDQKVWVIALKELSFMNRRWRVFIERNQESSYVFMKECGSTNSHQFSMNYSSLIFQFELTLGTYSCTNQMFYSFANGQNQTIGMMIPHLERQSHHQFNLKVSLSPCYIHSLCLETLIHSSFHLFQNQERRYSLEDALTSKMNSNRINKKFFPRNQMVTVPEKNIHYVVEWFLHFDELNLYWLLNHNLFIAHNERSILEMLMLYYEGREMRGERSMWQPLLAVRYRYIPLQQLLGFRKSVLESSPVFRSVVKREVEAFRENNSRPLENGRYHSVAAQGDVLTKKLMDELSSCSDTSQRPGPEEDVPVNHFREQRPSPYRHNPFKATS